MALLISLQDDANAPAKIFAFEKSPVRIGRNPLNDLTLDHDFVSQWHALLRFEGREVSLIDLGSTNGTAINGARLPSQKAVQVGGPSDEIQLGALRIELRFGSVAEATELPPRSTFEGIGRGGADLKKGRTAVLDPGNLAGQTAPGVALKTVATAVEAAKPAHAAYRAGWDNLAAQLRQALSAMPEDIRSMAARSFVRTMPELAQEPGFGELLTEFGIDPREYQMPEPRAWLLQLAGRPPSMKNDVHVGLAFERVGSLLEAFSESYVELRKGMEQFGAEMGLQLTSSDSMLHRAQSRADVLAYLLDSAGDGNQRVSDMRVNDLRRSFADVALHQVAMLNGVMAGGRELLSAVSPERASSGEGGDQLAVQVPWWTKLLPFGTAAKWGRFKATHKRLTEEDRFARVLFGREFIKAYYTVAGSNPEQPS